MGRSWRGVATKGRGTDRGDDLSASLSELPTYYLTSGVKAALWYALYNIPFY